MHYVYDEGFYVVKPSTVRTVRVLEVQYRYVSSDTRDSRPTYCVQFCLQDRA